MDEGVYKMVLDFLHVTYTPDESTVNRITGEIKGGMEYLRQFFDPGVDFAPGTLAGQYLCEWVLRAESGALDAFKVDFAPDLLQGRLAVEAGAYAEAMGYVEG